jgi:membrane fusion protein (multidrug efflux system)
MQSLAFHALGLLIMAAGTASAQPAASAAAVPCLMEAHRTIKLATSVAGALGEVLVDRGDTVTRGMPVARLESAVEEADVFSAEVRAADTSTMDEKAARRDYTQAKWQRLEKLRASSQFVSQSNQEEAQADARQAAAELEQARISHKLAEIDLKHAKAKLAQRTIRSTIDGVVTERLLSPGEYAYEQAPVVTVAELDPLNVEVFLPVARYGSVATGDELVVEPDPPVGGRYTARIAVIDRVVDERSGTFGIRLSLPNPGLALPGGIRCRLRPLASQ